MSKEGFLPECIVEAAENALEINFNHAWIKCSEEEKSNVKAVFKKEYIITAKKEITNLVDRVYSVGLYGVEGEVSADADAIDCDDGIADDDGYLWTFDPDNLTSYGVKIQNTDDGFLITYPIPAYLTDGSEVVGKSKAVEKALKAVKRAVPTATYYGYENYNCGSVFESKVECREFFSSPDQKPEVDEYIVTVLEKLWKKEAFWEEYECYIFGEEDVDEITNDFAKKYEPYLGAKAIETLIEHTNNAYYGD